MLKPFLPQSKCDGLLNAMKYGNRYINNIVNFMRVFTFQHRRLRYCNKCIDDDMETYKQGESMTVSRVRHVAIITDDEHKFDGFITNCMESLANTAEETEINEG